MWYNKDNLRFYLQVIVELHKIINNIILRRPTCVSTPTWHLPDAIDLIQPHLGRTKKGIVFVTKKYDLWKDGEKIGECIGVEWVITPFGTFDLPLPHDVDDPTIWDIIKLKPIKIPECDNLSVKLLSGGKNTQLFEISQIGDIIIPDVDISSHHVIYQETMEIDEYHVWRKIKKDLANEFGVKVREDPDLWCNPDGLFDYFRASYKIYECMVSCMKKLNIKLPKSHFNWFRTNPYYQRTNRFMYFETDHETYVTFWTPFGELDMPSCSESKMGKVISKFINIMKWTIEDVTQTIGIDGYITKHAKHAKHAEHAEPKRIYLIKNVGEIDLVGNNDTKHEMIESMVGIEAEGYETIHKIIEKLQISLTYHVYF